MFLRTFIVVLLSGTITLPILAQEKAKLRADDFVGAQRESAARNPEGVALTIEFAGGQRKFRQGEVMTLVLNFSSSRSGVYRLNTNTRDRSLRMETDDFHLDSRDGVADPLEGQPIGSLGGLYFPAKDLGADPELIHHDLNEWMRFDRPGRYRLYMTSPRISAVNRRRGAADERISITSNLIEFEIVSADRVWQRQQLGRAVSLLDRRGPGSGDERGCRMLRYLGTREAAVELIRRIGNPQDECLVQYRLGLRGSPHRDFIIEEMESRLIAPSQPVLPDFIYILTSLTVARLWGSPPEGADQSIWQRDRDAFREMQQQYAARLASVVARKTDVARGKSLYTLLQLKWDAAKLPEIAPVFGEMPPYVQLSLLDQHWKKISSQELLPALRRICETIGKGDREEIVRLRGLALGRLYELAPEEGRRLILAEIRRPDPRVGLDALTSLPDETLPELDALLIERLERDLTERAAGLVERYASSGILPRLRALLDEQVGRMACRQQQMLLAFLLRVDPAGSVELIRRAVQARGRDQTRCYPNVLRGVAGLHFEPELEQVALEFLDDPDTEVAVDAAVLLGERGSAAVEDALWRRLAKAVPDNQRNPDADSDEDGDKDRNLDRQDGVRNALRRAIAESPAWLSDRSKLERLLANCHTAEERREVEAQIAGWGDPVAIGISFHDNGPGIMSVGHYALGSVENLKSRLAQFPKGAKFVWRPYNEGEYVAEKEKLFREVSEFLADRGMKLSR